MKRILDLMCLGVAWTFYVLGDLASRGLVNRWPGERWEWPYRLYNNLMICADWWQGDLEGGPWGPIQS